MRLTEALRDAVPETVESWDTVLDFVCVREGLAVCDGVSDVDEDDVADTLAVRLWLLERDCDRDAA